MSIHEVGVCEICRRGRVFIRTEAISFQQWTDKGYVYCQATIPMAICDHCGSRSWEDAAEKIIDEAVQREYNKMPRSE